MGDHPREDRPRLRVVPGGAAAGAGRGSSSRPLTPRLIRATADAIAASPWAWALAAPPPPRLRAV